MIKGKNIFMIKAGMEGESFDFTQDLGKIVSGKRRIRLKEI